MSISPWVAGQTSATWTFNLSRGGSVFDLTGQLSSYISIFFYSNVQSPAGSGSYTKIATGAGTVAITSFNPGIITYHPASADTVSLTPGQYWIRIKVLMNNTDPDYSDYISLIIQA